MTFNSLSFACLLIVVLALYPRLNHKWQNRLLFLASYIFYGWWDYRFLLLLLTSTTVDYNVSHAIANSSSEDQRKRYLWISLIVNFGILILFKYFNFFLVSATGMLEAVGLNPDIPTLQILLPVGISFYTFQSLSYTIDVYRRDLEPAKSFSEFALFLSFFPQLVAGPIERATHLLPQIQRERVVTLAGVVDGIWLILVGYLKKVVIADVLAPYVDYGFRSGELPLNGMQNWVFVYGFAFQIYGDFSGYSDIARGVSKLMGFDLMVNFRKPYLVSSPSDFWQHWHISLSTWLRDYLYIPLGGNRGGNYQTYRNLMLTMLIGGLWHGAGYAYIFWGFYQGLLLCLFRLASRSLGSGKKQTKPNMVLQWLGIIAFFQLTAVGWLIFRLGAVPGNNLQMELLWKYLQALFNPAGFSEMLPFLIPIGLFGGLSLVLQATADDSEHFHKWNSYTQAAATCLVLVIDQQHSPHRGCPDCEQPRAFSQPA